LHIRNGIKADILYNVDRKPSRYSGRKSLRVLWRSGLVPVDLLLTDKKALKMPTGRPLVTLSYAQSLDGSIALRRGSPFSLSGKEALVLTHQIRAAHDAVLVGIGTVLVDNPRLTVRLVEGRNPRPVILDSHLRFPLDSNLLNNPTVSPIIAATTFPKPEKQKALEAAGAKVLCLPPDYHGWVELSELLKALVGLGIGSVMVEGGARVITSFLSQHLVDRLIITISPRLLGGLHAVEIPLIFGRREAGLDQPLPRLYNSGWKQSGEDIIFWSMLSWEEG
jgi:GTP cyclohydrolase II